MKQGSGSGPLYASFSIYSLAACESFINILQRAFMRDWRSPETVETFRDGLDIAWFVLVDGKYASEQPVSHCTRSLFNVRVSPALARAWPDRSKVSYGVHRVVSGFDSAT